MERHPDPTHRELRQFGAALPFVTVVAGWLLWRRGHPAGATAVWAAGGAASVVWLLAPSRRRGIYVGWVRLTYPIGWLVTHIVLAVVFFAVLTPIALVVRAVTGDPLHRRPDDRLSSYWTPRPPPPDPARYFDQS